MFPRSNILLYANKYFYDYDFKMNIDTIRNDKALKYLTKM